MTSKTCDRCMFVENLVVPGVDVTHERCRQGKTNKATPPERTCRRFRLGPWGYYIAGDSAFLTFEGYVVTSTGIRYPGGANKAACTLLRKEWVEMALETCRREHEVEPYTRDQKFKVWINSRLGLSEHDVALPMRKMSLDELHEIRAQAIDRINDAIGLPILAGGTDDLKRHKEAIERLDQSIRDRAEKGEV